MGTTLNPIIKFQEFLKLEKRDIAHIHLTILCICGVSVMVESIEELRKICQSIDKKKESLSYSVIFARKISIYFTKLLLYTNITPNQVTLLCTLIGMVACLFFVNGNPWYMIIGALLLELWYIFDHVDGEVARYRKNTTLTGVYLDFLSHYIVHPFIFVCASFGIYNVFNDVRVFVFGFSAALSMALIDLTKDCVYKAVLVTYILPEYEANNPQKPHKNAAKIKENKNQKGQVRMSSPTLYETAQFVIAFFRIPRIMHIILIASLLNLAIPQIAIYTFEFNTLYIILLLQGVITPIIAVGIIAFYVRNKFTEELYYSIYKNERNS